MSASLDRFHASERWLIDAVSEAVKDWFIRQCADPFDRMRLWYLPSSPGSAGRLVIAAEAPGEGFVLASDQVVSCAWTKDRAFAWAHALARKLPILDPNW